MISLTIAEKRVYAAVELRATRTDEHGGDYLACEICGHNGSKHPLQRAHKKLRSQGGETTEENVYIGCLKCHNQDDHGAVIVDSEPMWKTGAD